MKLPSIMLILVWLWGIVMVYEPALGVLLGLCGSMGYLMYFVCEWEEKKEKKHYKPKEGA